MVMKVDRIAFRSLKRAYDDAARAPGDATSHARFAAWARLVSRIVGVPITGCSTADAHGRDRWVRATVCVLFAAMATHYGVGVLLNPGKPPNPAPPRTALVASFASTASVVVGTVYISNTMTGAQIRACGLPQRRASTERST
jgi:hypothetical protein